MQVNPRIEQQQSGPHVLKELQDAWKNQEVMVRWLSRFFNYLDRCGSNIVPSEGTCATFCSYARVPVACVSLLGGRLRIVRVAFVSDSCASVNCATCCRYYVGRHNLPNLEMVALMAFRGADS